MNGSNEPPNRDVGTGLQSSELLAVLEDAIADRDRRNAKGFPVGGGELEELLRVNHESIIGTNTGKVNGQFTGCAKKMDRSCYRVMSLAQVLARIEERLTALGISADAASRRAGKPDAIRNIRRAVESKKEGRKGVNAETLRALADVLEVTPGWLMSGVNEAVLNPNLNNLLPVETSQLPVVGIVEAGAWRETGLQEHKHREFKAMAVDPRFPDATQFLLRVRGDSMNQAQPLPFVDNALARCIAWADTGMVLRTGMIVVARRYNGELAETTLKRVHEFPDRYELRPESSNPDHKAIVIERDRDDHADNVDVIAIVTGVTYEFDL